MFFEVILSILVLGGIGFCCESEDEYQRNKTTNTVQHIDENIPYCVKKYQHIDSALKDSLQDFCNKNNVNISINMKKNGSIIKGNKPEITIRAFDSKTGKAISNLEFPDYIVYLFDKSLNQKSKYQSCCSDIRKSLTHDKGVLYYSPLSETDFRYNSSGSIELNPRTNSYPVFQLNSLYDFENNHIKVKVIE